MRVKNRINQLKTIIIMMFVATTLVSPIALVSANPTTTLAAPTIVDRTLKPGSIFSINITIDNVSAMWGYMFKLSYDTSVLTATAYVSYCPFETAWPCGINDTAGYVEIAYSTPMAEKYGFYWSEPDPFPIANIEFIVDSRGWSLLDLHETSLADIYGEGIAHDVVDGFFSNTKVDGSEERTQASISNEAVSSTGVLASGTYGWYWERIYLDDTYSASGISGRVHVYKNWVNASFVCFCIALKRKIGLDVEFLEVGYFQNSTGSPDFEYGFYLFAGWEQNDVYEEITGPAVLPLDDIELEIREVGGETFEAKANGQTLKTFTFTFGGDRIYLAQGESHYSENSLRGHVWDLKYYDSSGEHIWQNVTPDKDNSDLYSLEFPEGSTNEFYTSGGGVLGDVDGDGKIGIADAGQISGHWYIPGVISGPLGYDSNADISPPLVPDGVIAISDASVVSAHWKEGPLD